MEKNTPATVKWPRRHRLLRGPGTLMVSTDLHGNGRDFRRLRDIFLKLREQDSLTHWVILGDLVHAPSKDSRREEPRLYDFEDESWNIVDGVAQLLRSFPDNVHLLLGNHDHGHIGGRRTSKFHPDEVAYLEDQLSDTQLSTLRELFRTALLVVVAECGVLMAHGSPDDRLASLRQLDDISLEGPLDDEGRALLQTITGSYGQQQEVTDRLLQALSLDVGIPLSMVIHGHDRDEEGWFTEGGNQICPVIFGAPRGSKRYLVLDLGSRYRTLEDLREGLEIRRLHGASFV